MTTEIIPYEPMYRPMLVRALEGEGLTEDQMTFENHPAAILMDDNGYVGFFSFRIISGFLCLNHFLVFKRRRSFANAVALLKAFARVVITAGYVEFVAEIQPGKEYLKSFVKFWMGKDEPYASQDGRDFYLMHVKRKGVVT